MAAPNKHPLENVVRRCRAAFDAAITRADQAREAAEDKWFKETNASASSLAQLQAELEPALRSFEALENETQAKRVRQDLAEADQNHRDKVKAADAALEAAYLHYLRSFPGSAGAMECSFNSAVADLNHKQS
jgi:chromosome segregation ATPase